MKVLHFNDEEQLEIDKGQEASRLLNNPLIKSFFSHIDESILDAKRECSLENDTLQRKLDLLLQVSGNFKKMFTEHVENGRFTEKRLQEKTIFNRRGL